MVCKSGGSNSSALCIPLCTAYVTMTIARAIKVRAITKFTIGISHKFAVSLRPLVCGPPALIQNTMQIFAPVARNSEKNNHMVHRLRRATDSPTRAISGTASINPKKSDLSKRYAVLVTDVTMMPLSSALIFALARLSAGTSMVVSSRVSRLTP